MTLQTAGIAQSEGVEQAGEVNGVAVGVVTQNRDSEGLARVRVRFPWRENSEESHFARIATPMAGPDRGLFLLPEVGDEVLCAFEGGRLEHPYIVGSLWNGVDTPPAKNDDGKNDLRFLRSRSGHELSFFDGSPGKVELKTKDGKQLVIDEGGTIEIKGDKGQNKLVIDVSGGGIVLKSATSMKLESQTIEMSAGASMTIKAGGTLTIQGALVQIN